MAPEEDPSGPKLYNELASWWPVFSPPSHYGEEARELLPVLESAAVPAPRTLLELGCGGGSMAFHLKERFRLTLVDRASPMLAVSRVVNPECEHVLGDMRSVRLDREFDLVFIHDAIMYATDARAVLATLGTAARHCRPGGGVVVVPDHVRETFESSTSTGGEDGSDGRALRYLEWAWDPDPADDTYEVAFTLMLRDRDGSLRLESDRHRFGLFPRAMWLGWLQEAGFTARSYRDSWDREVFVGRKP